MALTPGKYLCDKLSFKPEDPETAKYDLLTAAIMHLCGEMPEQDTDASKYYKRNHINGERDEKDISSSARLFPCLGGFGIALNPSKNKTEKDKNISRWHELAHTLFFKWENDMEVPVYEGMEWRPDGLIVPNKEEEAICDYIAEMICPKKSIFLGGKPAIHYNLVKRLKEEGYDVRYTSDEDEFEGLLQKLWYMPELVTSEIIHYDMVIMDTELITDEIVEYENTHTGPLDILREKVGEPPLVHSSRADYFLNNYFRDRFEDGLAARDDPIIILADEEIADQIEEIVEQREQRKLIRQPYDIDEVLREVSLSLVDL